MQIQDNRRARLAKLIREHFADSQAKFVHHTGENPSEVSGLLKNKSFGEKKARNIEKKCGLSPGWLDLENDGQGTNNVASGPRITGRVPLISWVIAGDLCESPDNFQSDQAEDWFDCPVPHSSNTYCLVVVGESMDAEDGYREGEIIFVDPDVTAIPGKDVVVLTPEGKTTFKRLKQDTEGLYLLALNGKKIIRVPEGTSFCGVVIFSGFRR
jgi:SOS-response transcriptional repressor LexA